MVPFKDCLELFSAVVCSPGRFVLQKKQDCWEDYRLLLDWWTVFNAVGDCQRSGQYRVVDTSTCDVVFGGFPA